MTFGGILNAYGVRGRPSELRMPSGWRLMTPDEVAAMWTLGNASITQQRMVQNIWRKDGEKQVTIDPRANKVMEANKTVQPFISAALLVLGRLHLCRSWPPAWITHVEGYPYEEVE